MGRKRNLAVIQRAQVQAISYCSVMESPNKRQSLVRRGEYEADVPTGASKAVPLVLSVGCAVSDQEIMIMS